MTSAFANRLGIEHPLIQAPMAGSSPAELVAAVSGAGVASVDIPPLSRTRGGARRALWTKTVHQSLVRRTIEVGVGWSSCPSSPVAAARSCSPSAA